MKAFFREYRDTDWLTVLTLPLREADQRELRASSGGSEMTALSHSLHSSTETYVILLDEKIVGVFGITREPLYGIGAPWFVCTDDLFGATGVRSLFSKQSRDMIDGWKSKYPLMTNFVAVENESAIRWLKWLGFQFLPTQVILHDHDIPFIQFYMAGASICANP